MSDNKKGGPAVSVKAVSSDEPSVLHASAQSIVQDIGKAPTVTAVDLEASSSRSGKEDPEDLQNGDKLQRGLKSRHLQMIAMGGTIGTGLFIASGTALAKAGPVSALIAYIWVGTLVYSVMLSLGEMATSLPIAGAFTAYASRFVDPSLGFAMGWIYWFSWPITFALELTALGLIIAYWVPNVNSAYIIAPAWCLIAGLNFLPVGTYGETQFWLASIKVVTVLGFILFGICIDLGAGVQGRLGFRYWKKPGAFAPYLHDIIGSISTARFVGFWAVLIQAGYSYQGTELVGLAVAEVENPSKNVPAAIKKTFYRILLFYVGTILFIGLLIPYTNPRLFSDSSDASASPFVIAADLAGVKVLPGIINAVLLTSGISAANSNVYSGSRILVGLADEGLGPKILARTNRWGVPYYSVVISASIGLLAFLNLTSSAANVFNWFVNISGVSGFICWASISFSHIRFQSAMRAQNIPRSTLLYQASWQPWFSYYGCVFIVLIIFTQGFTCFIPFSALNFFVNYISLFIFVALYIGHKAIYKTSIVKLLDADLKTGQRTLEATELASRDTGPSIVKRARNVLKFKSLKQKT